MLLVALVGTAALVGRLGWPWPHRTDMTCVGGVLECVALLSGALIGRDALSAAGRCLQSRPTIHPLHGGGALPPEPPRGGPEPRPPNFPLGPCGFTASNDDAVMWACAESARPRGLTCIAHPDADDNTTAESHTHPNT
jgi:hypothetical protein